MITRFVCIPNWQFPNGTERHPKDTDLRPSLFHPNGAEKEISRLAHPSPSTDPLSPEILFPRTLLLPVLLPTVQGEDAKGQATAHPAPHQQPDFLAGTRSRVQHSKGTFS